MSPPRLPSRVDGKLLVIFLAAGLLIYHLSVANLLRRIAETLSAQLSDEDERGHDFKRLETLKMALRLAWIWAIASAGMAAAGLVGVVREQLQPLRVLSLNSFLSLGVECFFLIFIASLAVSATGAASFSSSLCEAMTSNSDLAGSFDLFGWSVESCEERWKGLTTGLLAIVGAISVVRAWAAYHILSYHTHLAKRLRRQLPHINTSRTEHFSDAGASRELQSPGGSKRPPHRIFLLPNPLDPVAPDLDVPLLNFTPSSPLASFPPQQLPLPAHSPSLPEPQYLVYAPVMMTAEEARHAGAKEVTYSRPRARSHSGYTPTSAHPSHHHQDVPLRTMEEVDDDDTATIGKGKLA